MKLTQGQDKASTEFMQFLMSKNQKYFVLEGYSGCGKTTLTKYLIEAAYNSATFLKSIQAFDENSLNIELTATTHKAAEALAKATNHPTSTIHHLLKLRVFNDYNSGKTRIVRAPDSTVISNTLIFIDEASMANLELLDLIDACTSDCKIVFIMDPKQIPPVYEKTPPLVNKNYPTARLDEVVRQMKGNPIVDYATELRQAMDHNEFIPEIISCPQMQVLDSQQFKSALEQEYLNRDASEMKIVTWSNVRVSQYNSFIRELLHPNEPLYTKGDLLVSNSAIQNSKGDIIIKNEEAVVVVDVREEYSSDPEVDMEVWVFTIKTKTGVYYINQPKDPKQFKAIKNYHKKTKNWSSFFYLENCFGDFRPFYSSTVHKAQGSTYKTVFVDVEDICRNNNINEVMRLLYVAITRASDNVYLRGNIPPRFLKNRV